MNRMKLSVAAFAAVVTLGTGALIVTSLPSVAAEEAMTAPATAAEHSAEAAKYDQEALDLDAKAAKHTSLANHYKARGSGGSKQATALASLANHCERIAKAYRGAATEAREMAKMHREMATAG